METTEERQARFINAFECMKVACWLNSMQPFIAYANVYRLWQTMWSEKVREERFSRRRASTDRLRREREINE